MEARDLDRALHVLFSDNHLLVVAKPAGVPIVPFRAFPERER